MFRICYISSSRVPITTPLVEHIMSVSRRNNRAVGLTGLLVAGERRFLQLLEGDERAVRETFQRIKRDPRHFACVVINERIVTTRQFADWDMGLVNSERVDGDDHGALADLIASIDEPNIRAEFDGFLAINGRRRSAA